MANETEVPPALTREQWRESWASENRKDGVPLVEGGMLVVPYDNEVVVQEIPTNQLPRTIALANELLPDDSPYKITRADVNALGALIGLALEEGFRSDSKAAEPLYDKLTALLRPE